jgi:N-acyl homoserine lactone hydrolase
MTRSSLVEFGLSKGHFRLLTSGLISFSLLSFFACSDSTTTSGPRLYVIDCGQLNRGEPTRYGLTFADVEDSNFADPCYLIVHPAGTLLWELGIIPDDEIEAGLTVQPPEGGVGSNQAFRTLRSQLREIGRTPADITHLAFSHAHRDHNANANDYAGALWMVQREDFLALFSPEAREATTPQGARPPFSVYEDLEQANTLLLSGDHDVFGDGSVMLLRTPCHTAGHQALFVKLEDYAPVILSGDLYHYSAERTLNRMPENEKNCGVPGTTESRQKIEALITDTGAELWIQHDMAHYAGLKKSPLYYE